MPYKNVEIRKNYAAQYGAENNKTLYSKRRAKILAALGGKCEDCDQVEGIKVYNRFPETPKEEQIELSTLWEKSDEIIIAVVPRLKLACKHHNPPTPMAALLHGAYWAAYKRKCECVKCAEYRVANAAERAAKRRANKPASQARPYVRHAIKTAKAFAMPKWARLVPAGVVLPDHKKWAGVWQDIDGVVWLQRGERTDELYVGDLTPARILDAMEKLGVWVEIDSAALLSDAASLIGAAQ